MIPTPRKSEDKEDKAEGRPSLNADGREKVECAAIFAKSAGCSDLRKAKLKTINNVLRGRYVPRVGTVLTIWDLIFPRGLWSEDGHRFCRSLISQQDRWWFVEKSRYDYEVPFQHALENIRNIRDDNSRWGVHSWTSAVMVWGIATMSDISKEPYAEKDKRRRDDDERLRSSLSKRMLDQLERVMEKEGYPHDDTWTYFRARFAVDAYYGEWNHTERGKRYRLETVGRRVFSALRALLEVHWSNVSVVITATAIASRLEWRELYGDLLGYYATAVGAKEKEDLLDDLPGFSLQTLLDEMQVKMAQAEPGGVLKRDSDFTNFNDYWREQMQ